METLWDWLTSLYAVMAVLPFLSFFVFWLILYGVSKKKKTATKLSADITTFLLIGSVYSLWNRLFNSSFGLWLALLFVLVSFGLIGGYQNRQHGKADFSKVARISWRISFLCFTVLYAALLIWNIGKSLLAGSVS
ncbi:DUF3397 domain-containing protein [Paenibacillus larvae]|nr:DUF3397 domain-containing protein [Paenibacillus larvae]AVF21658.1 hypothetical protein ERICI_01786 [Paenibacillus larvae subsp. larvae]AVF27268.1 hypothetical protein ERICIII_03147 [Paenibacillus larvae subsp. larvae]AVF31931.1 hypothetical protein ERICIV_03050 [Paenibacillus larvae subsp. larvae]AVG12813.1 hypothetical protein ERICII_02452 [Paenibacillus larvae subsp. larvae DSM 25430]ETK27649.1 hypothetical protein ERIC1_1c10990 [Paenibacillus larvae subsp. larvae DSM 25719]